VTDQAHDHAATAPADDLAAAFQIEGWPVRGRIVRLGQTIDTILSAHAYPEPVAALLFAPAQRLVPRRTTPRRIAPRLDGLHPASAGCARARGGARQRFVEWHRPRSR
jgi:hypothetical protein